MPKPATSYNIPAFVDKGDLIPSIAEIKALSRTKKDYIIRELVASIKMSSIAGNLNTYKNYPPSSGLNMVLAEEIRVEFIKKGYLVTVFEDTSYRREGISFSIIWS